MNKSSYKFTCEFFYTWMDDIRNSILKDKK